MAFKSGIDIGKGDPNAVNIKWDGLDKVIQNLNEEVKKIRVRTVTGVLKSAVIVKGDAQRITPIDTGNLRNSSFIVWGGEGKSNYTSPDGNFKGIDAGERSTEYNSTVNERKSAVTSEGVPFAEIGFTANYALKVHENINAGHGKRDKKTGQIRQIGQWKFLESAFKKNIRRIIDIIKREALKD